MESVLTLPRNGSMVEHLLSIDGGETIVTNFTAADLQAIDDYYYSMSPSAIILVITSFFALLISIPGLAWHIKNRSLPASSMVLWIVILNLTNIINALVWSNDNIEAWWDGQIYCDFDVKLDIASTMGLVGSLTCIMRSLAQALDTKNIRLMPSKGQRIRRNILNIGLCVGLPLIVGLLNFVLQPIRYYVFAIAGCKASYSSSWYALLLGTLWPPILCLLTSYYAILLTIRIYRYRRDFSAILSNSTSGMNKSRFLRLFISALTVLLVVVPIQAYALYVDISNGLDNSWYPTSWDIIVYVPMNGFVYSDRWVRVGISLPVFLCFGWGKDTNSIYRSWLRLLGLTRLFPSLAKPQSTTNCLPITNPSQTTRSGGSQSRPSAFLSKAKNLFSLSSTRKTSTYSSEDGAFSTLGSHHDSARAVKATTTITTSSTTRNGDAESQISTMELVEKKNGTTAARTGRESVITTPSSSIDAPNDADLAGVTPVQMQAHYKSWGLS